MSKANTFRSLALATCATALWIASGSASATDSVSELDIEAGLACAFELDILVSGGHQNVREFVDRNGDTVRILSAGTGANLTFKNVSTGATVSFNSNGAVTNTVNNPDGSQTVELMGHNVLILFPTDVPAGPSTTLYVGRVLFTISAEGVFTLLRTSGTATDICAELTQ